MNALNADTIVEKLSKGVESSFRTKLFLLGPEGSSFEYPFICPEYLATVKIAEHFTDVTKTVDLEVLMNSLRSRARRVAFLKFKRSQLDDTPQRFRDFLRFGRKRIDMVVRSQDSDELPEGLCEVKLHAKNLKGVQEDIERLVQLLEMYRDLKLIDRYPIYAFVVFHVSEKNFDRRALAEKYRAKIEELEMFCKNKAAKRGWLNYRVGFLPDSYVFDRGCNECEFDSDGTEVSVLTRSSFSILGAAVLLGNRPDINQAPLGT